MDRKEREAIEAIKSARAALDEAIRKCRDAELSFMNVVKPLIEARARVNMVIKIAENEV